MKYIRFNTKTNKVIAICRNKPLVDDSEFTSLSGAFAVAEFNGDLPQGDYLNVLDAKTKTDKWLEKVYQEVENDLPIETEVERSRTYIACDLMATTRQYTAEQLEKIYNEKVTRLIRQKYDANAVEALLANYAEDKEKYQEEFNAFATYRKECKERAKAELDSI